MPGIPSIPPGSSEVPGSWSPDIGPVGFGVSPGSPRPAPRGWWLRFSLARLLLGYIGVIVLYLLVVAWPVARKRSKVTDCKNGLKQMGLYLNTYASRYGSGVIYPTGFTPVPAAVVPVKVPGARGGTVWEELSAVPTSARAVWSRPREAGLPQCTPTPRGWITATTWGYSGPDLPMGDSRQRDSGVPGR